MSEKINYEQISMVIITESGAAKSLVMEALNFAKKSQYDKVDQKLKEANEAIISASKTHFSLIQKEAKEKLEFKLLLMHAEDQLLTTQTLMLIVQELIEIYKKIN